MDSEPKKPEIDSDESSDSESEEEGWIDMLANTIIDSKNCETREKNILKFLSNWLDTTISNKKHKKDVWKLEKTLDILREHSETMRDLMSKAKEFEEMEIEEVTDREEAYAEYIMNRGDIYLSDDDDFSGPEESCGGKA
jgi:hypothetical protein